LDEFLRIFQDSIALAVAAQPGFGGITLLTDPRIDKVVALGFWETADDLLSHEIAGFQEHLVEIKSLLSAPPVHEVYETSVQVERTAQGTARLRGI
jgi:hypothetical protein